MSCRNCGCGCGCNQGNRGGSGCRRTGCFTATVPVTVTYQITPNLFDERAIISQIPSNNAFNNANDLATTGRSPPAAVAAINYPR